MPSGRFYGLVIGGSHPAALAADWLTSAWDQNAGMRDVTPAYSAVEDVASSWLLDLLGLPAGQRASASPPGRRWPTSPAWRRHGTSVLRRVGWDVGQNGLTGAPRVRVIVGAERHESLDLALRYLGLGAPEVVDADVRAAWSRRRWPAPSRAARTARRSCCSRPATCTPAASTPSAEAIEVAHRHGAWVHVDGAFGLFAAASRRTGT